MDKIRILLADDHPILREGLRAVLETQPDFEVIAEAVNGLEAVRLALTLQPDILLLDLEMPQLDGVETIRRLRQQQPQFGRNDRVTRYHFHREAHHDPPAEIRRKRPERHRREHRIEQHRPPPPQPGADRGASSHGHPCAE